MMNVKNYANRKKLLELCEVKDGTLENISR